MAHRVPAKQFYRFVGRRKDNVICVSFCAFDKNGADEVCPDEVKK